MPIVPMLERSVGFNPLPATRVQQPSAEGFQGLEKTQGAAIKLYEQELNTAQKLALAEKKRVDNIVGIETDYQLSIHKSNVESLGRKVKGKDALGWWKAEGEKSWAEGVDGISKSLSNDEQKLAFASKVANYSADLYGNYSKYADNEFATYEKDNRDAWEDLVAGEAAATDDDEKYRQSLDKLKAGLTDRYKDPLVIEDNFKDRKKTIDAEREDRRTKAKAADKEAKLASIDAANKDLTNLQIDGELSYKAIRERKDNLTDENYRLWVDRYRADLKERKARAEEASKPKDDDAVATTLSVEAMKMHADTTSGDIQLFKEKVAKSVSEGRITPATGRTIVGDAENSNKRTPEKEAAVNAVLAALKNDYEAGVLGKGREGAIEHSRQIRTFQRWLRDPKNLDKDTAEYYEKISEDQKQTFVKNLLDYIPFVNPALPTDFPGEREKVEAELGKGKTAVPVGNVKVVAPDGRIGYIPAGQLAEAIKEGYKESR